MTAKEGTYIVTGAAGGLGRAIVGDFLSGTESSRLKGLWVVRDPSKATELRDTVGKFPNAAEHEFAKCDLSSFENVRKFAAEINARVASRDLPPIRTLVLNAALQIVTHQSYNEDKMEMTFAVNYASNFLLAVLLTQSMDKKIGRIVIVSSWTHDPSHPLNAFITAEEHKTIFRNRLDTFAQPGKDQEGDAYNSGMRRYGASKTLIVMIMYEIQRRLSASKDLSDISVLAVDPGAMPDTALLRDSSTTLRFFVHGVMGAITPLLTYFFPNGYFRTRQKSARDVIKASFDETSLGQYPKGLYLNGSALILSSPETRDEEKQKVLWRLSVELTALKQDETPIPLD